uniref:Alpha2,3-sialyltransferase n=2 Tax=unclassified Vibrio TaxID=2614977 RepID=A8R0Y0_9VIBR|nr:alpha2,3-sialyltransferase [Vibrio sp. JT-FAJ-16]
MKNIITKRMLIILSSLFTIIGCNNDNSTTTNNNAIEIYVDRATLPTIQQMTKIVSQKTSNKKLISWSRYPITDKSLLKKINAEFFKEQFELTESLKNIILSENIDNLIIHGNTLWSIDVVDIIKEVNLLGKNIPIELHFYDDGSAEYVRIYEFSKLPESEQKYKTSLSKNNIKFSIDGTDSFKNTIENIYGFSQLYPTTYHMLRADIFDTTLKINPLRELLSNNIKQMKWDYFKDFNYKQKDIFYSLTNFNPKEIQEDFNKNSNKNFIFIGSNSATATAEEQINIISEAKKENSSIITNSISDYDLFFKGHPSATFNEQIINAHDMIEINNKIPFEALIMTGILPDAVGGMGSSVFFSIPKEVKNKFVFYKSGTDIENNSLIQVMLKLNLINRDNIKLISDI